MDRLISEQAIVDVLSKGYWDKNLQSAKDDPCVIDAMIDWAIRQIKAIPSAEPCESCCNGNQEEKAKLCQKSYLAGMEHKNIWIPVSERLPQKSEYGDVLVTYIPSAGTLWTTVMIAQYSDLMGIAEPCFHIGEVGKKSYRNITSQVTAWMPLPKAYRK